jgi:hypothetical protein
MSDTIGSEIRSPEGGPALVEMSCDQSVQLSDLATQLSRGDRLLSQCIRDIIFI